MSRLNKVIMAGKVSGKPMLFNDTINTPVCLFKLRLDNGWVNCLTRYGLAKICKNYLKAGRLVAIDGSYELIGGRSMFTVENLQLLDQKLFTGAK